MIKLCVEHVTTTSDEHRNNGNDCTSFVCETFCSKTKTSELKVLE